MTEFQISSITECLQHNRRNCKQHVEKASSIRKELLLYINPEKEGS